MSRFRDDGYVAVECIESDSEFRCPRADYPRLLNEWQSGAAFITLTTVAGLRDEERREAKARELTE